MLRLSSLLVAALFSLHGSLARAQEAAANGGGEVPDAFREAVALEAKRDWLLSRGTERMRPGIAVGALAGLTIAGIGVLMAGSTTACPAIGPCELDYGQIRTGAALITVGSVGLIGAGGVLVARMVRLNRLKRMGAPPRSGERLHLEHEGMSTSYRRAIAQQAQRDYVTGLKTQWRGAAAALVISAAVVASAGVMYWAAWHDAEPACPDCGHYDYDEGLDTGALTLFGLGGSALIVSTCILAARAMRTRELRRLDRSGPRIVVAPTGSLTQRGGGLQLHLAF